MPAAASRRQTKLACSRGTSDAFMSELIASAESGIAHEVQEYFPDMSVCRRLAPLIVPSTTTTAAEVAQMTTPRRRRRSLVEILRNEMPDSPLANRRRSPPREQAVVCDTCQTKVLSCRPCEVLKGYYVVWAETVTTLRVVSTGGPAASPSVASSASSESSPASSDEGLSSILASSTTKTAVSAVQLPPIVFHSIHFVHRTTSVAPRRASFALQSIFQPGMPTVLESYPQHMMHLGLLAYALWNAPSALVRSLARHSPPKQPSIPLEHPSGWPSVFPSGPVLILGLGGNVLGQCCDAILPPRVPLHVVELEPAVLAACRAHGQTPPLEALPPRTASPAALQAAYRVTAAHPRGMTDYTFFIADASAYLRFGAPGTTYSLIFLDCYDTEKETMMHSGDLLSQCRARLAPGGCLLVNAHLRPTQTALSDQFMRHGFATVQTLRVRGCDQTILACLVGGVVDEGGGMEHPSPNDGDPRKVTEHRVWERFSRAIARGMTSLLNGLTAKGMGYSSEFLLDPGWLTSNLRVPTASGMCGTWEHRARRA